MKNLFSEWLCDELKTLIAEIEAGQEPSNIALYERIAAALRPDYEREMRS